MRKLLPNRRKQWVLLILVTLVSLAAWLPQIDQTATQSIDNGLQRALISFASARALNAAISVAQGTEASIEPAGVGFTFAPGEVLDPVNDLVEQFSNLMLLASISFGVQKTLVSIGGYWVVSLLLSLTALIWAGLYLKENAAQNIGKNRSTIWASKLLVVLLMIRFAVPAVTYGSDILFEKFMSSEYETSQQFINSSSSDIEEYNQAATASGSNTEDEGIIERIRNWSQGFNFESPVEQLKASADMSIEHIVNIMVIFLMQTILLPLVILWGLYTLIQRIFGRSS